MKRTIDWLESGQHQESNIREEEEEKEQEVIKAEDEESKKDKWE